MIVEITMQDRTKCMLRELGVSPRHSGYKILSVAIPLYAKNDCKYITKDLYIALAKEFGYKNPLVIEHPIRYAISWAWARGDHCAWDKYFPYSLKAPSNLMFISTLAEFLR